MHPRGASGTWGNGGGAAGERAAGRRLVPITDAILQDPAPDDWLMWRRTLNGWGYSPLDEVDRDNVGTLRMVWSRALGTGLQQGTPLVYDDVMYMPNPSDVIQALDAATGDLAWEYRRQWPDDAAEYLFGGLMEINRNIAIYDGLIIDTSADDYVFALDATTGRLVWETEILDYRVNPPTRAPGRSWRAARSSRGAAARRAEDRTPASSPPTTRRRARSCGAAGRSRLPASPGTRPGAASPSRNGSTWVPGWCRATTRR